jgi:diacylglycerol kinase (ATP)
MSAVPLPPARLIVNPRAGGGAVGAALPELTGALEERELAFDVVEAKAFGHGAELARSALDEGVRYLVAVGGDGTVHDVVNGLFVDGQALAPELLFGVASWAASRDFARNYGLDRRPEVIARHLTRPSAMDIDVGVVRYTGTGGARAERVFLNIAQVGYGAEFARLERRMPRRLGRVGRLLTAWGSIRALERCEATVEVAQGTRRLPLTDLVVANGQFFQDGLKVALRALPDDGRFNVLAFQGQRSQVFQLTIPIFKGEHLPHPDIAEWQSPTVSVTPDCPLRVEADSVYLGSTPADFALLPRALRLKT